MNPRILILSFYYTPDLSAGAFRAEALVKSLQLQLGDSAEIDVITTRPNRYHNYVKDAPQSEQNGTINIRRVDLPCHKSGIIDQTLAFVAYARSVYASVKGQRYDLVVATSSRLMTASLGALVAKRTRARLYLDIRDIFVDTLPELFPYRLGKFAATIFSPIERWTIRQASRVNLISPGFLPYFSKRYPDLAFAQYTNGVDELFLSMKPAQSRLAESDDKKRLRVVYAGNLGVGQGLHLIIPKLAKRLEHRVEFHLIGAGGASDRLFRELQLHGVSNVLINPPMKRDKLLKAYEAADVLFLHLNDLKAFRKVLPSKLFEYAATGKPIWAGLTGYAQRFANHRINNIAIFSPGDIESAIEALEQLDLEHVCRQNFVAQYSRTYIKQQMAQDIFETLPKRSPQG
ncbi:glycosyltransferase family 4 protein [Pseudomonas kurunegalensis]|uniref:glycosyltransferase family 4 protein n=1 Tax=Pseudomonas kurunegalensis TaxID=485880 RepID=UPI00236320E2|nr:glycosyltransferase family 4 protein [Pseudomonas kurunegalensis]MDD2134843.1 glycosyltransferase family 4 protein [Pseudomonas kurunegalensis]